MSQFTYHNIYATFKIITQFINMIKIYYKWLAQADSNIHWHVRLVRVTVLLVTDDNRPAIIYWDYLFWLEGRNDETRGCTSTFVQDM